MTQLTFWEIPDQPRSPGRKKKSDLKPSDWFTRPTRITIEAPKDLGALRVPVPQFRPPSAAGYVPPTVSIENGCGPKG